MRFDEFDPAEAVEGNALLRELNTYRANGCTLKLNGKTTRPEQIARACLREHHSYMRDFVSDGEQQICEINFVRIRKK